MDALGILCISLLHCHSSHVSLFLPLPSILLFSPLSLSFLLYIFYFLLFFYFFILIKLTYPFSNLSNMYTLPSFPPLIWLQYNWHSNLLVNTKYVIRIFVVSKNVIDINDNFLLLRLYIRGSLCYQVCQLSA